MRKNNAFTLIELIVIVAIIIAIIGIALAKNNDFTEKKKLDKDAVRLVDMLETAKKKTVSGDLAYDSSCTVFNGYGVVASTTSLSLKLCCDADCDSNAITKSSYELQSTNSIKTPVNIWFAPLTGSLVLQGNQQLVTLTIKNSVINKSKDVTVSKIGVIEEGESQYESGC